MRLCLRSASDLLVKRVDLVRREDGYFMGWKGKRVKAVKHGNGVGVGVYFERSPVDDDFNELVWFPTDADLMRILNLLHESDRETHKMLGHGWEGKRPYHMLAEML